MAEGETVIKLCDGSYSTNIWITKPGIKIEPWNKEVNAYIMFSDGPVVTIELKEGETCILNRLIISHLGNNLG